MIKPLSCLIAGCALLLPLIHPYGPVRQQRAPGFMPGVPDDGRHVRTVLERACRNCHSEQTEWPFYSYLPVVSWATERDVHLARGHMDLSAWDRYSSDQQQDLLARIGSEIRNHRMPPGRFVLLHPEGRLSEAEIQAIYDWTKAQRRTLRTQRE